MNLETLLSLSYSISLSILYPALKLMYRQKVREKIFSTLYSLAIFIPIYVSFLHISAVEFIIKLFSVLVIAPINYLLVKVDIINFNRPIGSRDLILPLAVVVIIIVRVIM
ncbi:MAG: hypothetical protein ABWJ42_05755 [Sulfolobales archaeon]